MRTITRLPHLAAVLVVVASAVLAGCGDAGSDKAGGEEPVKSRVLTLADTTLGAAELDAFASAVEKRSGRRLRIDVKYEWQATGPDYETKVIDDVKAGKADLAWAGSRIWSSLGVKSLEPLHAPFLIDSYDLEGQVLASSLADEMLAGVDKAGVHGIALLPGAMRLLLTKQSVTDGDLEGRQIGMQRSKMAEKSLRALGGTGVALGNGESIRDLDGVEQQADALFNNHYSDFAKRLVADQPMWPRPVVVFANAEVWNELSEEDRRILTAAGEDAREAMLAAIAEKEQRSLDGLCRRGVRLDEVGATGREALRRAVEPVYDELRGDPATKEAFAAIEGMHDGSPPATLECAVPVPAGGKPGLEGTFTSIQRESQPGSHSSPNITRDIPRWPKGGLPVKATFADGRAVQYANYGDGWELGFEEPLRIYRDHLQMGEGGSGAPIIEARWEIDGDTLKITDVKGGPDDIFVWQRTWKRAR